jgi:tetratricopeptide (TPR) repeat protein/DNA-binding SARP family transcriptional activator
MEFRLLGAVEIAVDGRVLNPGPSQQRLVMAILAAEAGRPVSVESLIDRTWDEPPEHPRRTLQVYLSRLRRLLDGAATSGQPVRVVRRSGGYLLDIDPDRVDIHRFRSLISQARHQECPQPERAALLGRALELWRGQPLADLPGGWATRFRQGLQQQYLEAVAGWAEESVRAGDPGAVLARLGELVGEHPLVESLATAYMRALYAAGRPADALKHFDAIRHRLADELGTDPSPELQQLHRQILTADPALSSPEPAATGTSRLVPRQLPAPPQGFTGRAAELAALDQVHDSSSTVVIAGIDGMAGVGKTALAVQAAHHLAGRYPDGQLFIDLHGYTHGVAPIQPAEALDHLLRALGIPGTQIPTSLDQRAALYRTRLAEQRMLIVLDNAAAEAQVAPLLPGVPGCLVLVTSRRRLAGLDHTHTLSLDTLPAPDAITLFVQTAGEDRLAGQPAESSIEVVESCGRLPLAIRIAAARLRSHPSWQLSHLVERLRDQRHRLGELEAGQRSVTAALDLSYHHLDADQQRAYRLLGRHPGPEFDRYAAAALLGSTVLPAGRVLDQLLEANLLHEPTPGRYRFHDLTRAHAAPIAEPSQDAALDRLLDYYRHTAAVAMHAAYPYEREDRSQVPRARTASPDLPGPAALGWLDTELPNLLAAARYASEHGRPAHVLHLSAILHGHLRSRGRYHDAESLHQQALATARATADQAGQLVSLVGLGDSHRLQGRYQPATDHYQQALQLARTTGHRTGEMNALAGLGDTHRLQGRYQPATDHYQQALQLARTTGHRTGEMNALAGLGQIHRLQGRHTQAADHYQQALRIARATGHRPNEMYALGGLGHIHLRQGRYQQATDHYQQARQLARTTGHRIGELTALNGLGHLHRWQGRYQQAAEHYQQALEIARTTSNRTGEMNALTGLGDIHRRQGRHQRATDYYQQLLTTAQESGDRNCQFEARQGLGRLRLATGRPDAAIAYHEQALALASELNQPHDQARAHDGLAHAHHTLDQHQQARTHWQQALDLLTDLRVDQTDDEETNTAAIRTHLAALTQRG